MEDKKALKAEMKTRKKAYKKAKRKYVQPWKALSQFFAFLMVIMVLVCFIANMADNTFAIIAGDTFWELENPDENAIYFDGDYATTEERLTAGAEVVYRTEAEGATLLVNENNALPLTKGNFIL